MKPSTGTNDATLADLTDDMTSQCTNISNGTAGCRPPSAKSSDCTVETNAEFVTLLFAENSNNSANVGNDKTAINGNEQSDVVTTDDMTDFSDQTHATCLFSTCTVDKTTNSVTPEYLVPTELGFSGEHIAIEVPADRLSGTEPSALPIDEMGSAERAENVVLPDEEIIDEQHQEVAGLADEQQRDAVDDDDDAEPNNVDHEEVIDVVQPLAFLAAPQAQGLGDMHQAMMQAAGPIGFQPYRRPPLFALRVNVSD